MFKKITKTTALLAVLVAGFTSCNVYADSAKRASIAYRLFNLDSSSLYYDYNYYGQRPVYSGCTGYYKGHSGLDIQTKDKFTSRPFYALASGTVTYAGGGSYNTIAVYNSSMGKTVLYLHASKVSVNKGQAISAGTQLGYQGSTGANGAVHVHLEVRSGSTTSPACGASTSINPESVF